MWNCEQCSEAIDENFDACWNCGAARDGTPNPIFDSAAREHQTSHRPVGGTYEDFYAKVLDEFECIKCGHDEPNVRRVTTLSTEVKFFSFAREFRFLVVSCNQCGCTEFYDARIACPASVSFLGRLFPWL